MNYFSLFETEAVLWEDGNYAKIVLPPFCKEFYLKRKEFAPNGAFVQESKKEITKLVYLVKTFCLCGFFCYINKILRQKNNLGTKYTWKIFGHFYEEDNLYFQIAFLHTKPLLERELSKWEEIVPKRQIVYHFFF